MTMLLLAGDIQLNPGPGVIGGARCVVLDYGAAFWRRCAVELQNVLTGIADHNNTCV